jgi:hypothetical protein
MTQANWSRFMLRLPPDLKRLVDAEAERNGASINSEIIRSIRERMDRAAPVTGAGNENGDGAASLENSPRRRSELNADGDQQ